MRGGLDRPLEDVAKAVAGGSCQLQMPLKLTLAVRETVAGHRLGALKGGGGYLPFFKYIPGGAEYVQDIVPLEHPPGSCKRRNGRQRTKARKGREGRVPSRLREYAGWYFQVPGRGGSTHPLFYPLACPQSLRSGKRCHRTNPSAAGAQWRLLLGGVLAQRAHSAHMTGRNWSFLLQLAIFSMNAGHERGDWFPMVMRGVVAVPAQFENHTA